MGKKYIICFSLVKEENNFLEKFTEVSVRVPCRILACFGRYPEAGGGGGVWIQFKPSSASRRYEWTPLSCFMSFSLDVPRATEIGQVILVCPESRSFCLYASQCLLFLVPYSCWIKDDRIFYISVVAYFCLIFLTNLSMFCTVLVQLTSVKSQSQKTRKKMILNDLRGTISLTFLLGLTWGFAFFAWGPVRIFFMYLFAICNTLQGNSCMRGTFCG